ncbi:hypothetical protein M5X00_31665 [Paenibacillus alvei]|uniref:Uncharacterized protein n=1 Tax=Paenibacillus alvei TaxID=44250 RepID=A0ABT4H5K5_PAEAL|nr:hypothetical protein [Paenibacillus alvei]EJW16885.1 hypothetical protein PAV_5c04680 [Paenibacillus alvei DSM 29]EJW19882.1 hypothetical protein PAV_1c08700 [Paenibacillus alvei DSM 29]MCY7485717.1 hypothetical protein [Paenibacillus alvei]MCY9544136.1 hypothetical protein [Paenibacillus alvei]MCY9708144.1 hypothetical protein [Paenibacillus alvei]
MRLFSSRESIQDFVELFQEYKKDGNSLEIDVVYVLTLAWIESILLLCNIEDNQKFYRIKNLIEASRLSI